MNHERTHLDLFSGIGGFALAAQWNGVRTVGFCEREPYAQQVLKERFGAVADAPSERRGEAGELRHREPKERFTGSRPQIHSDICQLDGTQYRGTWLLTGGFPCQPFSLAGKRLGASDDRALWPQMLRVISECRPAWVLGENVPGIITMELDRVLLDLAGLGYACRPFVVPACAVDAKHRRDRVWIVANATGGGVRRGSASGQPRQPALSSEAVANAGRSGLKERDLAAIASGPGHVARGNAQGRAIWQPEPDVGRVANGVPARAHRLRGLGNAIVPQVAAEFIRFMIQAEEAS